MVPTSSNAIKPVLQAARSRGVVLVITLSMILLLVFVVLAFFTRVTTNRQIESSSASGVRAGILATSAAETIISDLRAEIAAGSTRYPAPPDDSQPVYLPTDNLKAIPARVLAVMGGSAGMDTGTSAKMYDNLVKQSTGRFFPSAGFSGADPIIQSDSGVRTDVASLNGRTVGWAQWQAPGLTPKIAGNSTGSPFDSSAGFTDSAHLPRWLLVTRQGVPASQAWDPKFKDYTPGNMSAVIGRFAFNIYDVGGLLDVNAIGFPTGAPTGLTVADKSQELKGTQTGADLSVIPGVETSANADKFATAWKYLKSKTDRNTFLATWRETAEAGFLRSGTGDNINYGRQDLIRLAKKGPSGTISSGANGMYGISVDSLPYLTSFSRDLEQPSYFPDPNRPKNTGADGHRWFNTDFNTSGAGGNSAYISSGTPKQDAINPALLTVRDANDQPVMKRRFALNRLAWLTHKGPWVEQNTSDAEIAPIYKRLKDAGFTDAFLSQGTPENIKRYFGLRWDPDNSRWLYVSPDGTTIAGVIKTLDQVALVSPAREPDFFETLYAVICCDALGKQQGAADFRNRNSTWSPHCYMGDAGFVSAAIDGSVEFQIMQIGANLIDQFDADSFPTCVAFADPGTSTTRPFFGVENLPYLAGWRNSWYRMRPLVPGIDFSTVPSGSADMPPTPTTMGTGSIYETCTMVQPIIWNPHAVDSTMETSIVPTEFRVLAAGVTTLPPPATPLAVSICPEVWPTWWAGYLSEAQSTYPPPGGGALKKMFPDALIDGVTSCIEFNSKPNTLVSVPSSFQEPYRLLSNYPPGSNSRAGATYTAGTISLAGAPEEPALISEDTQGDSSQHVIGFYTGTCWTGPSTYHLPYHIPPVPGDHVDPTRTGPECLSWGRLSENLQLQLQYRTAGGNWLTYDVCSQVRTFVQEKLHYNIVSGNTRGFRTGMRVDPRTNRWGMMAMNTFPTGVNPTNSNDYPVAALSSGCGNSAGSYSFPQGKTLSPSAGLSSGVAYKLRNSSSAYMSGWTFLKKINDVMVNLNGLPAKNNPIPDSETFYTDPDGVLRRAIGGWMTSTSGTNGLPMATGNFESRPVILNRPFQSVAEMGYTFSGTPWKELDFFAPESGYTALLDAFCVRDLDGGPSNVIAAGRVNLNTRQPKVLQAIIQGASKAEGGTVSSQEAEKAAQALINWTTADPSVGANQTNGVFFKGPLRNRAELVGKFVRREDGPLSALLPNNPVVFILPNSYRGYSEMLASGAVFSSAADATIKRRRECVMRALADSGNTRTWNLLIDVIAQTGRYPMGATASGQFVVEGESRFWVHLAIDRYTGNVVAKQMEPIAD